MKVSEAKKKVCPFVQEATLVLGSHPIKSVKDFEKATSQNKSSNINCICGECMAWIYTKEKSDFPSERKVFQHEPDENGNTNSIAMARQELKEDEKEGYCARIGND